MIWQFFAKIIAEGAIIEQNIARAARKLPEDEGKQPKTQVNIDRFVSFNRMALAQQESINLNLIDYKRKIFLLVFDLKLN